MREREDPAHRAGWVRAYLTGSVLPHPARSARHPLPQCAGLSGETTKSCSLSFRSTAHLSHPVCKSHSPPVRGEREGPLAHRRCATRQAHARVRREGREGEVGDAANRFLDPPHPALSPPPAGGEDKQTSFAGNFTCKL